jgi:transcriptional regulator with XRE-family HTH domain
MTAGRKRVAYSDPLIEALGAAIRDRRQELLLSQRELASRSGLHESYICNFEKRPRSMSLKHVSCLAAALKLTVSQLLRRAEQSLSA